MAVWLKQSTSVTVKIGPFVDDTDGKTAETGLTLSQSDILLSKNGGALTQKNETSACAHDAQGYYDCVLNTTDTNTPGALRLAVNESGALPVWRDFMVVPANVYDSLIGNTDYLDINVKQVSEDTTAADNAEAFFDGTGYAGTNNTIPAVTNVTNLTNAPTVGDFTATMKTSLNAATPAGVTGNVGGNVVGSVGSVTGNVGGNVAGSVGSVTGGINTAAGVITTLDALDTAQDSQHGITQGALSALAAVFSGITSLAQWLGLLAGKQTGNATARAELRDTGVGSGTYDEATDSQEALRDRGDAAWTTATGFSTLDEQDVANALKLAPAAGAAAAGSVYDDLDALRAGVQVSGIDPDALDDDGISAAAVSKIQAGLSVLDAQAVADALKLAPAAGAPDAGSVYDDLDVLRAGVQVSGIDPDALDDDGISAAAVSKIQAGLSVLDAQAVADALKLAPAAGAAAAGSVYDDLDALRTGVQVSGVDPDALDDDGISAAAVSKIQAGLSTLTADQAADAVWDEPIAGEHDMANSAGQLLQDAGALGTPLTAQEVRDAMLLAPTPGAPDSGSIDDQLADLAAGVIVGSVEDDAITAAALAVDAIAKIQSGLSTLTKQQVADALKLGPAAGAAADGSVYALLDDLGTQLGSVSIVPAALVPAAGTLTIQRGDTLAVGFTLGDISARAALWLTVKYSRNDTDARAAVQVEEGAGLLIIAGDSADTPANASITVTDEETGAVTLTVAAEETAKLLKASKAAVYDWQMRTDAGVVRTLGEGTAVISLDVTQAVNS